MRRRTRASSSRVVAALAGALAILALVAGPGLAHPGSPVSLRTGTAAFTWTTNRAGLMATISAWVAGVEAAMSELESEAVGPEATEAPEETETPEATDAPDATEAPEATDQPEATDGPEATDENNNDQGQNEDANESSSQSTGQSHDGGSDQGDGSGDHNGGGDQEGGD